MGVATGPGFYGKLPHLGDFVQRGLPAAFVAAWDAAFQPAVAAARAALGGAWPDAWRAAPAWRFALAPDVCGPAAWVGVMRPACDRVGRAFPLVLACAVEADARGRIAGRAGGWFAALEQACAAGDADASAEAFAQRVAALPDPLTWLHEASHAPRARLDPAHPGTSQAAWRPAGEDPALAEWAQDCAEVARACLWWTTGGARVSSKARVTRGLPRPDAYLRFLADSPLAADATRAEGAARLPAALSADGDTFAGLLGPAVAGRAPEPSLAAAVPPAVPSAGRAVVQGRRGALVYLAADNGAPDARREAAARTGAALETAPEPRDVAALLARLLPLNAPLHARSEDLVDPVPEDGAVVAALLRPEHADVLQIGAARAWHWRRGELQPVFASAAPVATVSGAAAADDLDSLLMPAAGGPGLGAAGAPACATADCATRPGDRLLLLATAGVAALPAPAISAALDAASTETAAARLAAAAHLDGARADWPLVVIEVGA